MKITITKIVAAISMILLVTSCSIQKRHFNSGYYISWKKHSSASLKNEAQVSVTKEGDALSLTKNEEGYLLNKLIIPKENPAISSLKENALAMASAKKSKSKIITILKKIAPQFQSLIKPEEPKKYHIKSILAFSFGLAAFVTYYGAIAFAVLAIIFAISAKRRINAEPDKYKGMSMAKWGLILGIIGAALGLLLILLPILF